MRYDDIVLIAVGGGAEATIGNSDDTVDIRYETLTNNSGSTLGPDDIVSVMRGYRVVVLFSILGGRSSEMMPSIISDAKGVGCKVVAIAGIPFRAEKERRARALDMLPSVVEASDRTLILDMGTVVDLFPDINVNRAMKISSYTTTFSINNLIDLINGPFFSTFPEKAYTFAYVNDESAVSAMSRIVDSIRFETDPTNGKAIVLVSSGLCGYEMEQVRDAVVGRSGILPEVIKRSDGEDTKFLLFVSVRL